MNNPIGTVTARYPSAVLCVAALVALLLVLLTSGCHVAARAAQGALEPVQVYVRAPEGAPAASGLAVGLNARYLAVAGHARGSVEVWAPTASGPAMVWSASYDGEYRPHAWEIVLWEEDGAEWLRVAQASWTDARASLRQLPDLGERPLVPRGRLEPPGEGSAPVRLAR
jgi:hypothetical protein